MKVVTDCITLMTVATTIEEYKETLIENNKCSNKVFILYQISYIFEIKEGTPVKKQSNHFG